MDITHDSCVLSARDPKRVTVFCQGRTGTERTDHEIGVAYVENGTLPEMGRNSKLPCIIQTVAPQTKIMLCHVAWSRSIVSGFFQPTSLPG